MDEYQLCYVKEARLHLHYILEKTKLYNRKQMSNAGVSGRINYKEA